MADLIDRDALMKEICGNECGSVCDEECENVFCNFYDYIMDAPAVNRWIPCSERLPESFIYVLCAGRDGIGILRYIGSKWLDGEANAYTTNEITHWMPLPEPPEKEAENG
jgi:hypothetical protein